MCPFVMSLWERLSLSKVYVLLSYIFSFLPGHILTDLYPQFRILKMMRIVASHKAENLMSISAVAACMAPLLLRPLLAGDCEVMGDFDMGGDGSVQFLQAAAAANHAQAIVGTLMEEFDKIFLAVSFTYHF